MWGNRKQKKNLLKKKKESFSGRAAVICDKEDSAEDAFSLVEKLAKTLEMNTIFMASEAMTYTQLIFLISHITSYVLANTVLEKKEKKTLFSIGEFGFSSTVRLAKSHPEMWVPIFKQNKENVLDVLNEIHYQLRKFKACTRKKKTRTFGRTH